MDAELESSSTSSSAQFGNKDNEKIGTVTPEKKGRRGFNH